MPAKREEPLNTTVLTNHAKNKTNIAQYLMNPGEETTQIMALDLDDHKNHLEFIYKYSIAVGLCRDMEEDGIDVMLEQSGSGTGFHIIAPL